MDNANTERMEDLFLVIRLNAYTSRIDDGYIRQGKSRIGALLTPAEIAAYIAANPKCRIDPLRT